MTTFDPQALLDNPQEVTSYLVETGTAPAAVLSITDRTRTAVAAAGLVETGGANAAPTQSYEIGSQTKMMTALVVLQLAEEGLIDLERPLAQYLDAALIEGVANADVATVGQALAMKTGIVNYTEIVRSDGRSVLRFVAENQDEVFDTEEILDLLDGLPANAPVGTAYEYSNTNYFYLSQVIEAVTGQTLGQVFEDRIFAPLGMEDSYLNDFRPNDSLWHSYLRLDGETFDVTEALLQKNGEGGVVSSTADMTRFIQALLVDRTLASDTVLAQMIDFENGSVDPRGFAFSNGLALLELEGLGQLIGFSGGTLGTDSATYLHVETGHIIAAAISQANLDVTATTGVIYSAALAQEGEVWASDDTNMPVTIAGFSAAGLDILATEDGATLRAGDAVFQLDQGLSGYASDDFHFTDQSRLALGTHGDDAFGIGGRHSESWQADNQLRGFGGDDRLAGGAGDDLLVGGGGADVLRGRAGQDRLLGNAGEDLLLGGGGVDRLFGGNSADSLSGGRGRDRLDGGAGGDRLTGGAGADAFVFRAAQNDQLIEQDTITDFEIGFDRLVLRGRNISEIHDTDAGLYLTLDGDGDTILLEGLHDTGAFADLLPG